MCDNTGATRAGLSKPHTLLLEQNLKDRVLQGSPADGTCSGSRCLTYRLRSDGSCCQSCQIPGTGLMAQEEPFLTCMPCIYPSHCTTNF